SPAFPRLPTTEDAFEPLQVRLQHERIGSGGTCRKLLLLPAREGDHEQPQLLHALPNIEGVTLRQSAIHDRAIRPLSDCRLQIGLPVRRAAEHAVTPCQKLAHRGEVLRVVFPDDDTLPGHVPVTPSAWSRRGPDPRPGGAGTRVRYR